MHKKSKLHAILKPKRHKKMIETSAAHRLRTVLLIGGAVIIVVIIVVIAGKRDRERVPAPGGIDLANPKLQIHSLSGIVVAREADRFTLDVPEIFGVSIRADSALRQRNVFIVQATKLVLEKRTSDAVFARELALYEKKKASGAHVFPPSSGIKTPITFGELALGDYVTVDAASDLKNLANITAEAITIKRSQTQ